MRHSKLAGIAAALLLAAAPLAAQEVVDHLGIPGPVSFAGEDFALAWSSQPTNAYTKQEYLPAGQSLEAYDSMVLIEFLAGDLKPADAAAQQATALNERRASDPIANFQMLEHPQNGEIVLDFVLSSRDEAGEYIIEWNGYRYAPATDAEGNEGVMLFGISRRAYGNDASRDFLTGLGEFKTRQVEALVAAPLPQM